MDISSSLLRQMPVSVEAEQALLGSIIVSPDAFDKIGGMISAEDFYVEEHKHIYSALLKMYSQNKTIDAVTLVNCLVENGDRDEAGGIQYITLITESVPSAARKSPLTKICPWTSPYSVTVRQVSAGNSGSRAVKAVPICASR